MPRHIALFAVTTVFLTLSIGIGADSTAEKSNEAEVRQVITSLQANFNRGDAKGVADCWIDNGEFSGPNGGRIIGRDKIEGAYREFLAAHPDSKVQFCITSMRFVSDDVALVDLLAEMTPTSDILSSEPTTTAVLVYRDSRWRIASLYEMLGGAPPHRLQLKNLQWMTGEWMGKNSGQSGIVYRSTCDWNANGTYLIRKFNVVHPSGVGLSGTEIIGWNPRNHRICSWTFDSDGSFGESTWTRDANQWTVEHQATLTNGGDLSVTYVVTPVNADTIKVTTKDRVIDGQRRPDPEEMELIRVPAQEKARSETPHTPNQVLP